MYRSVCPASHVYSFVLFHCTLLLGSACLPRVGLVLQLLLLLRRPPPDTFLVTNAGLGDVRILGIFCCPRLEFEVGTAAREQFSVLFFGTCCNSSSRRLWKIMRSKTDMWYYG